MEDTAPKPGLPSTATVVTLVTQEPPAMTVLAMNEQNPVEINKSPKNILQHPNTVDLLLTNPPLPPYHDTGLLNSVLMVTF
ncbi:rCG42246 [Rattus norvegicus]|uniref:RCG42246 n=1 Tax=Rattus norvegicus TaxID=10116 RepID=A6KUH6_RAT|nr:rCG42246 [Rattus norvegicus]